MERTALQALVDIHRPDALRILDFPHAAEHLNQLLEAVSALGHVFPARMLERCLHVLKHRGPDPLVRMADRLSKREINQEAVREHVTYLRKRLPLMAVSALPTCRLADWLWNGGECQQARG
jgi:hypothetical protein